MKKVLSSIILISLVFSMVMLNGCKKKPDPPTLTTTAISGITVTAAVSGGNVTSDGGAEVTARGVCWGTATKPLVTGSKTSDGKGTGTFTSNITGLTAATLYYVRAYATNSEGTSYGNEVSFTTNPIVGATLTTTAAGTITASTAVSGGNITADGGAAVTARGVCWGTAANPTTAGSKTSDGTGTGTFTSNLTGLTPGTLYHIRAYATNSSGTAYGNDLTFTTLAVAPTVTTAATVTAITQTTATSGGNVTADGGANVTARGVCWGTAAAPVVTGPHTTDGTGTGQFTSSLTGLTTNTLYYVRAYATNSAGTSYGNEVTFNTSPILMATVTTASASSITNSGAVSGGEITSAGGGTVSAKGICWSTAADPTIADAHTSDGAGIDAFVSSISGLAEATVYYVRAYATNEAGTAYGNQIQVRTLMSDLEGNLYRTVTIGTQIWMAENLKAIKFKDNSDIPNVTDNTAWRTSTGPAFSWYNNDEANNKAVYGALYNWFAVNTGNLCPTGWHVPTTAEFQTLEISLGMTPEQAGTYGWRGTDQGTQMKNTTGWAADGNGTNTSGFSALPGGYRFYGDGSFAGAGILTYFWSATEMDANNAWYRRLDGTNAGVYMGGTEKVAGKSVRCVKD